MSHKSIIKCEIGIRDENYLEQAIAEFPGVRIKRNAKPRGWGGQMDEVCDYVLEIAGSRYDVGLKKNNLTGTFDLVYDTFSGEIEAAFGTNCYKLVNAVKAKVAAFEVGMSGFTIQSDETLPNGKRRMVAVRY